MRKLFPALPLLLLAVVGCGRVAADTTISADGSLQRKVVLQVSGEFNLGSEGKETKIDDLFVLPPQPPYTLKREKVKDAGEKGTLERTVPAGATITDDVVLKGKEGGLTSNQASVRTLPDGRIEYRETIKWTGKENTFARTPPELRATVKAALSEPHANTETIDKATAGIKKTIWKIFFGPGDPLLPTLFLHPDLGARKLRFRMHNEADSIVAKEVGDSMDAASRAQFIKNFIAALDVEKLMEEKDKAPSEATNSDDKGSLISMLFVVKAPGKIVETNGEIDPVNGEVSWAFFGEAAQAGEVEMRLVYQPVTTR